MEWVILAILSSIIFAVRADINRKYQLDGFRLNFWRSLFTTMFFTPIMFYIGWPSNVSMDFYILSILSGALAVGVMSLRLNLTAQHNGRIANIDAPIKTFAMFAFWLMLDENSRTELFSDLWKFAGVIFMFILATYALNGIRKNDSCWKAFILIAPTGIVAAGIDVFIKQQIDLSDTPKTLAMAFVWFSFLSCTLISASIIFARKSSNKPICPENMIKAGFLIGFLTMLTVACFWIAITYAPNPAYVVAIGMLSPVWLLIYHRIKNIPDDASPYMGTLLVISAIGIILITI